MEFTAINSLDRTEFVARLGAIFEHSPWIAERAWASRPFRGVAALHEAMATAMRAATRDEQLGLLRAHPELAGREANEARLTADSQSEQASAGLDRLNAAELRRLLRLNADYRAKFKFPFIIAVRTRTKHEILAEFERRLARDTETERLAALGEIDTIARMRLERLFELEGR